MVCFGLFPVRKECEVEPADVGRPGVVVGIAVCCYLNTGFVAVVDSGSAEKIQVAADVAADIEADAAEHLVDRDT